MIARPRILVSNDDGIYSPGLACLATVAQRFGDVRVVAPDVEQSSSSHSISSARPVRYRPTRVFEHIEGFRVNGTPADCVALGIELWGHVDLVLSGINLGTNLGNALWHSGTLAAAKQATLLGIRAAALSASITDESADFAALEPWVEQAVTQVIDAAYEPLLTNVNIPPHPRGARWVAQAVDQYDGKIVPATDPMGRQHYWFTVVPLERPRENTDLWAFQNGYMSLTPLRLDLTDQAQLSRMRQRRTE